MPFVSNNQTLLDAALLYTGEATALVRLAAANGLSITDDLATGTQLSSIAIINLRIAAVLAQQNARPAGAITGQVLTGGNTGNVVRYVRLVKPVYKIADRQTMLDAAVLYTGNVSSFVQMALLNGLGITDDLYSGQVIAITPVLDSDMVAELKQLAARPASGIDPASDVFMLDGIGYWRIGFDFVVS